MLGTTGRVATKAQLLAAIAHLSPLVTIRYEVDSVSALRVGNVATVDYRLTDRRTFRAKQNVFVARALDVFAEQGGQWRLLRHSQTWIVAPPATIALDPATLSAFVGRYDHGAGYIDNVHFVGGDLVATSTEESLAGDVGAHLLPVSTSAFSPEGMAPLIVFERDASGRVTGYVQQAPDGTVTRARRLDTAAGEPANNVAHERDHVRLRAIGNIRSSGRYEVSRSDVAHSPVRASVPSIARVRSNHRPLAIYSTPSTGRNITGSRLS